MRENRVVSQANQEQLLEAVQGLLPILRNSGFLDWLGTLTQTRDLNIAPAVLLDRNRRPVVYYFRPNAGATAQTPQLPVTTTADLELLRGQLAAPEAWQPHIATPSYLIGLGYVVSLNRQNWEKVTPDSRIYATCEAEAYVDLNGKFYRRLLPPGRRPPLEPLTYSQNQVKQDFLVFMHAHP